MRFHSERKHYDGSYTPDRLRRAATRAWERLGPNQVRVRGTVLPYYDVNLDLDTPCDCMDAQVRGRGCLHELKARMVCGEMGLVEALGEMLLKAEKFAKQQDRALVASEGQ